MSKTYLRSRDESGEQNSDNVSLSTANRTVDLLKRNTQSVTKTIHTTISKDWTDRETLEVQRLVALQEKSELNNRV